MSNADLFRKAYSLGASHALLDNSELVKTALRMDPRLVGALGGAAVGGATGAAVDDKNRWRGGMLGAAGGAALGAGGGHLYQNAGKGATKATKATSNAAHAEQAVKAPAPQAAPVAPTPQAAPAPAAPPAKPQPGRLNLPAQSNAPGQVLPPPIKAEPPRVTGPNAPNDPMQLTRSPQIEWGEKSIAPRKGRAAPAPASAPAEDLALASTQADRRAPPKSGANATVKIPAAEVVAPSLKGFGAAPPAQGRGAAGGGLVPPEVLERANREHGGVKAIGARPAAPEDPVARNPLTTGSRGKFTDVDQAMQHKLLQGRDPAEVRQLIASGLVPHSAVDVDWALRQRAALGNNPEAIQQAASQWKPISTISDDPWQKRYLMRLVPNSPPGKMVSASFQWALEKMAAERCASMFGV